jgi:hypothetical protein
MVDPETHSSQNGSGSYELSMLSQKSEYSDKKMHNFFFILDLFSKIRGEKRSLYDASVECGGFSIAYRGSLLTVLTVLYT